jgi:hypothetical protein
MLTACVLINTLVSQDSVKKFRFQKMERLSSECHVLQIAHNTIMGR